MKHRHRVAIQITAWLDENCGADGWAMTPSGVRGVLNDAVSIYFADATLASAFVAHWCVGYKVETADGAWQASHCLQRSPRRRSSLSDSRRCSDERRSGIVTIGRGALQRADDLASRRRGQMPSPQPASDLRDADHRGLGETDERIHQDREAGRPDSCGDVPRLAGQIKVGKVELGIRALEYDDT